MINLTRLSPFLRFFVCVRGEPGNEARVWLSLYLSYLLTIYTHKEEFRCYEAKIEESEKAGSHRESNPGHLDCAASALPLSYDNQTTTGPHNPLYVLHRWDWNTSVATPGSHSVCAVRTLLGIDWITFLYFRLITSKFLYIPTWGKSSKHLHILCVCGFLGFPH